MEDAEKSCPLCMADDFDLLREYKSPRKHFLSANNIVRCQQCGLVFAHPIPLVNELKAYYEQGEYSRSLEPFSEWFGDFTNRLNQSRLKLIRRFDKFKTIKHCLDIGAGNASFGFIFKQVYPKSEYDAVEPDQGLWKNWGNYLDHRFQDTSEAAEQHYSLVILNQVLEHVRQPVDFVADIAGKLTDDGLMYVDVPFRDDLYKQDVEPHLLFFDMDSLAKVLQKAGLQILFCDSSGMQRKNAARVFQRRSLGKRVIDPWSWIGLINRLLSISGTKMHIDNFSKFKAEEYGGERQWVRCIAQNKTNKYVDRKSWT